MSLDAISAYKKYFDHNAWLCHWVNTPNLDELVHNGVSSTESHSANPVCSPSRSVMFSGRYSLETGVVTNNIGIDESVPNMGQWFEKHSNYERVPRKLKQSVNANYLAKDGKPTMFLPDARDRLRRVEQVMLFDMKNDPWEMRNLAAEASARGIIAEHEEMLAATESRLVPGTEFTRQ